MSRQYQIRAESFEVFCDLCAVAVAKELADLDGFAENCVTIEPASTLRSRVKCGRCTDWISNEIGVPA